MSDKQNHKADTEVMAAVFFTHRARKKTRHWLFYLMLSGITLVLLAALVISWFLIEQGQPKSLTNVSQSEKLPVVSASHTKKDSIREIQGSKPESRKSITTGPWEWHVVSFEFAESYTLKSNVPGESSKTLKAKDSQNKLAVIRVLAKPIREYTPDETAMMKKTYVGQVALAYLKAVKANLFLATRCFVLGDAIGREVKLTPCQTLIADKNDLGRGISFDDKDPDVPHVEVAYTKDEPIEATLVFSNVRVDGNHILYLFPMPAGKEMGKEIGAAHIIVSNQSQLSIEYGDNEDIRKGWPP